MPFASKIGYSSVSQVSTSQLKSVRDLGGSRINEIKDVVFPLSKRGLYVSFVNGFTATMTTIGSIIFLVYPSQKVATLVMFDVIESGKYDIGSVIAFYIIVICFISKCCILFSNKQKEVKDVFKNKRCFNEI